MNTTLQVRVDKKTKEAAQRSLRGMGLNLSAGIKLFIAEVARTNTVPFTITSADLLPESEKEKLVQETKQAVQKGGRYKNASALHRSLS